ncbi:hypothetical protein XELAEV_18011380mg [Xenopus laevis]|uniref:GIY-YIG domain-containing protein n=1 Tax=Xenopus laevis TaxID=8355 RepID=A0A974DKU3_XENLA|nr:hypothetical protein XELAEV_18011380mg [Xenopus laevis]
MSYDLQNKTRGWGSHIFFGKPKFGTAPVIKGDNINHPTKGYKISLKCFATCDMKQFSFKCPFGLVYIGQTMGYVKTRIKEHKGDIRNFKDKTSTGTLVSRHLHEARHNQAQLCWQVLEVVKRPLQEEDLQKLLLQREAVWIKKIQQFCTIWDECGV